MRQPQATHHVPMPEHPCYPEIDIGLTTVKAVAFGGETILLVDYRCHNADVHTELARFPSDIAESYPGLEIHATIIGSGGLAITSAIGIPFVRGITAGTESTRRLHPGVGIVIELGGEDARLIYLHPAPEQRTSGTCADGTGALIDQMATLLRTDASGLSELAAKHTQPHPIASRCGVFAKSDIQPLTNQRAAHEDLAASIFTVAATQTTVGLACGCPIRSTVIFLGGPPRFLLELRRVYEELLPEAKAFAAPENAQLYVAIGAVLLTEREQCRALTSPDPKDRGEDVRLVSELVDTLATTTIATGST